MRTGAACLLLLAASCRPAPKSSLVSGTIETDEVRIASRYGGRVEKLGAQEGDALKRGQVVVELEASELSARRDQAAAQVAEWEAGPRKEEIEEANQSWEALQSELAQARADARRAEQLFSQNTISAAEKERTTTQAHTLEKNVAAAKSRYELLLAGTRPERIAQARAQMAEIETQLREMKISAPADSVLEVLSVKVGDVVQPNREVATLLLPQHLWVRVYVPEPWLGKIKLGEKVAVRVDSDPGTRFSRAWSSKSRGSGGIHAAQRPNGRRTRQAGLRNQDSPGQQRRKIRAGMAADVTFSQTPK